MSHYIPPLLSATTFLFSAGGSEHARGPLGVCAEWYMRFFLRTVVTVLLLPKSWKKGNSKLQSEASWTVRRGVVTQRYADVSCKVTEKGRELWEKEVRKNSTVKKKTWIQTILTAEDTQILSLGCTFFLLQSAYFLSYLHLGGMRWLCCGGRELI